MTTETHIYSLACPIEGKVRYVGKTRDAVVRYKQHISPSGLKPYPTQSASGKRNAKQEWIADLLEQNLKPELAVLEILERGEDEDPRDFDRRGSEAERAWIHRFLRAGAPLANTFEVGPSAKERDERMMQEARERGRKLAETLMKGGS